MAYYTYDESSSVPLPFVSQRPFSVRKINDCISLVIIKIFIIEINNNTSTVRSICKTNTREIERFSNYTIQSSWLQHIHPQYDITTPPTTTIVIASATRERPLVLPLAGAIVLLLYTGVAWLNSPRRANTRIATKDAILYILLYDLLMNRGGLFLYYGSSLTSLYYRERVQEWTAFCDVTSL